MPDCTYFLVPELTEPGRGAEVCLVSKRMFIPDDTPVLVEKYYILTRRNKRTLNMVACSATSVESCLCLKALRAFPKGIPMLVGMAPGFQQRENRVLHLLGRIAGREEPLHVRLIQEKLLTLIGLLLGEQGMQVVLRQCASLAHLFKSAGLYKGWRGLLRTISGTITPLSRMLSTSSFISISLRTWNGWLAKVCNSAGETFNSRLFGMINPFFPSFISHKAKYIYKIRTFLLTFSVQSVIIIKLIRDSSVDRV